MSYELKRAVISLDEASDLSLVGGKAHALHKMIQAGFTVPAGFVISAGVFMAMTDLLQGQIFVYYDALDNELVAVRSSAIGEDGHDAAWAGQLDTFLNCNRSNLIESVEKCWQSAFSERAKSYASQKDVQSTKVAVIVQQMVQSEVSGVAFSVHPVTQNTAQVVIEAGLGLGEAIVSGEITPDTYIVNKHSGTTDELYVAEQGKQLIRGMDGQLNWESTGDQGNKQKLSNQQITELCQQVMQLEKYFSYPVDVEWAFSDNRLYILQCRPITTLSEE